MSIIQILDNINVILGRRNNILALLNPTTQTTSSSSIKLTEDDCRLIGKSNKIIYLNWINGLIKPYGLEIKNFHSSFKDGYVLCALAEKLTGEKIYENCKTYTPEERNNKGLEILNKYGVSDVLQPGDEWTQTPEELSTQTYLFGVYNKFCKK